MKIRNYFIVVTSLILFSCGSSISSDAQKVADLQCKVKELQQKALSGDSSSSEEVKEFIAKSASLVQEMNTKYASLEEKQQFQEELMKAKADCN